MRFKTIAVAVTMLAVVAPMAAQAADDAAKAKPDKKVCRRDGPATGSILGGHVTCHTKSEWAAIDKANTDAVDRLRNNQSGRLGPDAGGPAVAH